MRKQKITSYEYTLERKDVGTIRQALIYARHRLTKHTGTGAKCMSLQEVERLIKELS